MAASSPGTSCTTSPQLFLALLRREEQKSELCWCRWRDSSSRPPASIPEKQELVPPMGALVLHELQGLRCAHSQPVYKILGLNKGDTAQIFLWTGLRYLLVAARTYQGSQGFSRLARQERTAQFCLG